MVVCEALKITEKRKKVKGKGKKERYTHLNAEFQRRARRHKKAFLSDQCKEIEENNRMRETRDLFKEIRDTKGTFHAKMGTIKDRIDMDITDFPGGSDHELLIAEFRLKLEKVGKTSRPSRYDLNQTPYDYTVEVRNRFKGLDLIDRVPEELWTEVRDIV